MWRRSMPWKKICAEGTDYQWITADYWQLKHNEKTQKTYIIILFWLLYPDQYYFRWLLHFFFLAELSEPGLFHLGVFIEI